MADVGLEIESFLLRYGEALRKGNLPAVIGCWAVPAFVIGDERAIAIKDIAEVEREFALAVETYLDLGRVTNELTILEFERLSVNITSVDVEWMARNASDEVISTELFRYVLSGRDSGDYRIRCAIERTPV